MGYRGSASCGGLYRNGREPSTWAQRRVNRTEIDRRVVLACLACRGVDASTFSTSPDLGRFMTIVPIEAKFVPARGPRPSPHQATLTPPAPPHDPHPKLHSHGLAPTHLVDRRGIGLLRARRAVCCAVGLAAAAGTGWKHRRANRPIFTVAPGRPRPTGYEQLDIVDVALLMEGGVASERRNTAARFRLVGPAASNATGKLTTWSNCSTPRRKQSSTAAAATRRCHDAPDAYRSTLDRQRSMGRGPHAGDVDYEKPTPGNQHTPHSAN